jgi:hypothetical protein
MMSVEDQLNWLWQHKAIVEFERGSVKISRATAFYERDGQKWSGEFTLHQAWGWSLSEAIRRADIELAVKREGRWP